MKKHALITVFILFVLSACEYDAPLVGEASLPIDPVLLGTWESIPEDRTDEKSIERMVIRQDSANLYEIMIGADEDSIYAKAWLAELEKIRFIQVQLTGDYKGPVDAQSTGNFSAFSYTVINDGLAVQELNNELIPIDLADTAALQAAFIANKDDPSLFRESAQFRKISGGADNFTKKW